MIKIIDPKKAATNSGFLIGIEVCLYFNFSIPSIFMMLPS